MGQKFDFIVTVEDGVIKGGLGSAVLEFMADNNLTPHVKRLGLPDTFVEHGPVGELHKLTGLDAENIAREILQIVKL